MTTTIEFQKFAWQLQQDVNKCLDQFPLRSWFAKRDLTKKEYLEITYTERVPLSRLVDNQIENGGTFNMDVLYQQIKEEVGNEILSYELHYLKSKFEQIASKTTPKKLAEVSDFSKYYILAGNDESIHKFGVLDQKFHICYGLPTESIYLIPTENTGVLEIQPLCSMYSTEPAKRTIYFTSYEYVNLILDNPEEIICLSL